MGSCDENVLLDLSDTQTSNMKHFATPVVLFLIGLLSACSGEDATQRSGRAEEFRSFDYGKVEGRTYVNRYFNLELEIPQTWEIQQPGKKKDREPYEADLFSAVFHTPDPAKNSGLDVNVIRKSNDPAIIDGADYLESNHSMMKMAAGKDGTVGEIRQVTLGGDKFHTQTVEMHIGPKPEDNMSIEFYVRPAGDYWLQVTIAHTDEARKAELYWLLKRSGQ
jgi:hypothetical protein